MRQTSERRGNTFTHFEGLAWKPTPEFAGVGPDGSERAHSLREGLVQSLGLVCLVYGIFARQRIFRRQLSGILSISSGRVFIMNTIPRRELEPFRQK